MVLEGWGYCLCCSSPLQKSLMESDTVGFFQKASHAVLVGSFLECSWWTHHRSLILHVPLEPCWVSVWYLRSRFAGKALSMAVLHLQGFLLLLVLLFFLFSPNKQDLRAPCYVPACSNSWGSSPVSLLSGPAAGTSSSHFTSWISLGLEWPFWSMKIWKAAFPLLLWGHQKSKECGNLGF